MGARFSYLGRRIGRKVYIFASCNQEVADIRVCGPLRHNFHQDPRISQWLLTKNEEVIVFLYWLKYTRQKTTEIVSEVLFSTTRLFMALSTALFYWFIAKFICSFNFTNTASHRVAKYTNHVRNKGRPLNNSTTVPYSDFDYFSSTPMVKMVWNDQPRVMAQKCNSNHVPPLFAHRWQDNGQSRTMSWKSFRHSVEVLPLQSTSGLSSQIFIL